MRKVEKIYITREELDNAHFNLMSMRDFMFLHENYEEVEKIEKLLNAMIYGMTVNQWNEIKEIVAKREMMREYDSYDDLYEL